MTHFDKACWLQDISVQMQELYFDWGLTSIKLSDYQIAPGL